MNGYWNNLRPMEKRLVVGVGTMVVILLNLWFVVPHFSDLTKVQQRKDKAQHTLEQFQKEISRKTFYENGVREMQGQGQDVQPEDQIFQFQNAIQSESVRSGVQIQNQPKPHSQTNTFFIEQIQSINLQAKEQQLVDFLFKLGDPPSLVRVRDLTLHADPSHTMLQAGIKLVASYQKKPRAKSAPAPEPASNKSTHVEKKSTLRTNPNTPTNQGPATTKSGVPPPKAPGPNDNKSTPTIKKP
jgi:hypothetical protein